MNVSRRLLGGMVSAGLLLISPAPVPADSFVPFVPTGTVTTSPLSRPVVPIDTTSPRVLAEGGHFVRAGERIRFWGVNTTFGGNIPDKSDAPAIARRMARAGINSVRFHHLDTSRYPAGIWNSSNGRTLQSEALDRLDYFIAQLAAHGIYTNLNLHVGRKHSTYLGLPDPGTDYDKIAGIFTPALVEAQKDFARALLDRVNPYRGVRHADDPAVAMVEITNEDSFFMWDGDEKTRAFPPYYASLLQQQFNSWLLRRYGSTEGLRSAWNAGVEPPGANLLLNADFQTTRSNGTVGTWITEQHAPAAASAMPGVYRGRKAARVAVTNITATDWHLQFKQVNLSLHGGRSYTVSFGAAAESTRPLTVGVSMDHDSYANLGLSRAVTLTPDWTTHTMVFTATTTDTNARLSFTVGGSTETLYLADAELRAGGVQGLLEDESPVSGTVRLYSEREALARVTDRLRFLAETEKAYFDSMRSYVRDTLGCRALVTGTIVFGPLGLYAQSGMDFIDSHSYWKHPQFPGRPWDMSNWTVDQAAMADRPPGTLYELAVSRLAGKPFTVTEYNHSAPNDYQAECVPEIASFAALQDWDGVWLFDYGTDAFTPEPGRFGGFFGIVSNPAKWGFMAAGAALFRDGLLSSFSPAQTVTLGSGTDPLGALCDFHLIRGGSLTRVATDLAGVPWQDAVTKRLAVRLSDTSPSLPSVAEGGASGADSTLSWPVEGGRGFYLAEAGGTIAAAGHAGDFAARTSGRVELASPAFAAVTLTPLDGRPLDASESVLVAACGRCENTGMGFSADRRTVGTSWGTAPVRVEALTGTMTLPAGPWKCEALNPDGSVRGEISVRTDAGGSRISIGPADGTMWYLFTRGKGNSGVEEWKEFAGGRRVRGK